MPRSPTFASLVLRSTLVACLAPLAWPAAAVTLHGGDVFVLAREATTTPGVLLHVNVASGTIDTLVPHPPLVAPRDLTVRSDGTILVADATLGLVGIDPGSGEASVLAAPADLGGSGPTTLAFAAVGDLLLAGPWGVSRIAAGQAAPIPLSPAGLLVDPTSIVDDGAGGAYLTDDTNAFPVGGFVLHVTGAGTQSYLDGPCNGCPFPILPLIVRRGPDGFLYVVSAPYSGPSNYLNAGIYRLDPGTGDATRWRVEPFVRGFVFTPGGDTWVLAGEDISRDPFGGILGGPGGTFWTGARGPIALVPDRVTPVRARSWGTLKTLYR